MDREREVVCTMYIFWVAFIFVGSLTLDLVLIFLAAGPFGTNLPKHNLHRSNLMPLKRLAENSEQISWMFIGDVSVLAFFSENVSLSR